VGASAVSMAGSRGGLARLKIDRPPVNVLGSEDLLALASSVSGASAAGARVLLVTGLPRAFSAGVSIEEHVPREASIERILAAMRAVLTALIEAPAVTVAAVRGACLGGGAELACACDVVFVAEDARVGFPEIRLACFPPGAAALLPLRVGPVRASDWILSGRTFSGREAFEGGFASRVAAPESLEEETERYCEALLSRGGAALRAAAGLLREPRRAALAGSLVRAEEAYRTLAGDPDLERAVREWEKRGP
jgi:cyclohexa-1,5-dienecarbonyl-CoA hydratase